MARANKLLFIIVYLSLLAFLAIAQEATVRDDKTDGPGPGTNPFPSYDDLKGPKSSGLGGLDKVDHKGPEPLGPGGRKGTAFVNTGGFGPSGPGGFGSFGLGGFGPFGPGGFGPFGFGPFGPGGHGPFGFGPLGLGGFGPSGSGGFGPFGTGGFGSFGPGFGGPWGRGQGPFNSHGPGPFGPRPGGQGALGLGPFGPGGLKDDKTDGPGLRRPDPFPSYDDLKGPKPAGLGGADKVDHKGPEPLGPGGRKWTGFVNTGGFGPFGPGGFGPFGSRPDGPGAYGGGPGFDFSGRWPWIGGLPGFGGAPYPWPRSLFYPWYSKVPPPTKGKMSDPAQVENTAKEAYRADVMAGY